jgi:glucose/arabinose dehydrogenase
MSITIPPDEFIHVKEGANYGWPLANPNPDKGLDRMPFDPDYDTNRSWSRLPESTFTRIDKGIPAHSAPLGLSFLQATKVPAAYRNGAVVALHGSWNRSRKTGCKIIFFPWLSNGQPGIQADLVTGWLNDELNGFGVGRSTSFQIWKATCLFRMTKAERFTDFLFAGP